MYSWCDPFSTVNGVYLRCVRQCHGCRNSLKVFKLMGKIPWNYLNVNGKL